MNGEEAETFVKRFLRTMEARDLEAADAMMAPGARITFPGGKLFASQREMVEASRGRYQWVKKTFEQVDAFPVEEAWIVYVIGTLHGVNCHGISFSDVRYIDRFRLQDGLITRQDVWNDLSESGVLDQTQQAH